MSKAKESERSEIIKRINKALEIMPIGDLRNSANVIIRHPYMRVVLAKDTSIIFHYSNDLFDINHNVIKEKESNEQSRWIL